MLDQNLEVSRVFRQRVAQAFEESDFTSYRQVAIAADMSGPAFQQIIKGKFDGSKTGPGIFGVKRIGDVLGYSASYFLGEDLRPNDDAKAFFGGIDRPAGMMEEMVQIFWRGGARYEAFLPVLENFDIYQPPGPTDESPKILRLGRRTAFTARLKGPFLREAQLELDSMSDDQKSSILAFHRNTVEFGMFLNARHLDHPAVTRAVHVRASNAFLGFHVRNEAGEGRLLAYCPPIPA